MFCGGFFMACTEDMIYSDEYYDLIIDFNLIENYIFPDCLQNLDAQFKIGYYPRQYLPPLSVTAYGYSAIPKVFCLTDTSALEVTNILFLQNQPALDLKGEGVMVGFVDTGINYQDELFQNSDGTTRIVGIWDQTIPGRVASPEMNQDMFWENEADMPNSGNVPEDILNFGNVSKDTPNFGNVPDGFLYGTEYTEEEINLALNSEAPLSVVPSVDENGHGTFLAGVTCGGGNPANDFIGAVPLSAIAMVKCKQTKENLREYYHIPSGVECYQENDIMTGVAWLQQLAEKRNMPLVVCISMGSGLGSHSGDSPLSVFLNNMGLRRGRAVAISAGNEANARHHYEGRGLVQGQREDVEISVGNGVKGFVLELWASVPELYQVAVVSPTGEVFQPQGGPGAGKAEHTFIFEGTTVSLEYDIVVGINSNQLAFLRFTNPLQGIWIIRVTARQVIQGSYNMWLPMSQLMTGEVFFLRSTPDITATTPSFTRSGIGVGAFVAKGNSIYPDSGRGFSTTGEIKPDLAAPGVNVMGPDRRGNFTTMTGTSVSTAITAGACAQLLEWGIVKGRYTTLNSSEIRTILTRGARRDANRSYPNREWGFGALDVFEALNQLRDSLQ